VTNSTDAYDAGETIRDASMFPLSNASNPVLEANATVDNGRLTNLTVIVQYSATRTATDEGSGPFYTDEVVLDASGPGEGGGSVTATVPIDDMLAHRDELADEFGDGVEVSVALSTRATYAYETPSGQVVHESLTIEGDIERVGNLYTFPTGSDRATHRTGTPTPAEGGSAPFLNWLALVLGLGAFLLGLVTVAVSRLVDEDDVRKEIRWERFRDWVTEVESYTPQGDVNTVQVTNLNDLVNLAIDTNRRVLYHSPLEEYIVVEGDVMYTYKPQESEARGSTELFGISKEDLDETAFPNFDMFDEGEVDE
jgi:hypothetical protein